MYTQAQIFKQRHFNISFSNRKSTYNTENVQYSAQRHIFSPTKISD